MAVESKPKIVADCGALCRTIPSCYKKIFFTKSQTRIDQGIWFIALGRPSQKSHKALDIFSWGGGGGLNANPIEKVPLGVRRSGAEGGGGEEGYKTCS